MIKSAEVNRIYTNGFFDGDLHMSWFRELMLIKRDWKLVQTADLAVLRQPHTISVPATDHLWALVRIGIIDACLPCVGGGRSE